MVFSASSVLSSYSHQKNDAISSLVADSLLESSSLPLPVGIEPAAFLKGAFTDEQQDVNIKFLHGTTTLAFVFQGGVIVAVDSRASMGSYIGSQNVKKAIEITPYLLGTMAGGAADCQFWQRHLGRMCRLHELRNKDRISVAAASKLLSNILHGYRGMGLSMGTMIAGWDKTGPNLYYVDNDGLRVKNNKFSVGSGSPYAYGVLDQGYRHDLTVDEAIDLARRSIFTATYRDAASGGSVTVFHITEQGWRFVSKDDVKDLHDLYKAEGTYCATSY